MNRTAFVIFATALVIAPWHVQAQNAQSENKMSDWEFRQVLMDVGAYIDSHKGTDLRKQFESVSEDVLRQMHSAVAHPQEFKNAVMVLKKHDVDAAAGLLRRAEISASSLDPQAVFPSCPANTIIDTAAGSTCTPPYPDPNNTAWQNIADSLNGVGAFTPPTAYSNVNSQACGLTVEANLQRVSVTFQGLLNSLTPICSIIPAPINAACFIPLTAVAIADSASQGLYSDCLEQDGLVNAAEIDSGFHNTVTIYNSLKAANTDIDTRITNANTDIDTRITSANNEIDTRINNASTDIDTRVNNLSTQVTNVNNQITGEFTSLDTHVTTVDNHVASEITALDAHLVSLVNQLNATVGNDTSLLAAYLKQIMKMQLTPDGLKAINPAILTCTGANCPNVLANCPAAGCIWNSVGPLP